MPQVEAIKVFLPILLRLLFLATASSPAKNPPQEPGSISVELCCIKNMDETRDIEHHFPGLEASRRMPANPNTLQQSLVQTTGLL